MNNLQTDGKGRTMNWRDVKPGVEVYHGVYTHWGKGIVQRVVCVDYLEALFERGSKRVLVQFEAHDTPTRMRLQELRKSPNRAKIKRMVAIYQKRGVDAKDGGDRLILPGKERDEP